MHVVGVGMGVATGLMPVATEIFHRIIFKFSFAACATKQHLGALMHEAMRRVGVRGHSANWIAFLCDAGGLIEFVVMGHFARQNLVQN